MTVVEYFENCGFDFISNIRVPDDKQLRHGYIVGLGALIMNGYSYENLVGNLVYLCKCKEFDGLFNGLYTLVYIEEYLEPEYGFEDHVSTPERTICDFIMYPEELSADLWVHDAIQGYIDDDETPNDFHLIYEMLDHFGVDRSLFDRRVKELEKMEEM